MQTVGDVIRKYRKQKGLTQEEMADRLGVTAPAVNKWEKNSSLPDVALLAPIARLLGITTDELLCFRGTLSDIEIQQYLTQLQEDLERKEFPTVLCSVQEKIREYPNAEHLIWQAASILDGKRQLLDLPNQDAYDAVLYGWYERCLQSEDEGIRNQAADALFHAYVRREDYEKAVQYLAVFSRENPERKRKQALVDGRTGKRKAAYRALEELLYTGYLHTQNVLEDLRILYREDGDRAMVHKLADLSGAVAAAFEMGRYHEVYPRLGAAAWEQDTAWTAEIVEQLLESADTIVDFVRSPLYRHMNLKPAGPEFAEAARQALLQSLENEAFAYMREDPNWETWKSVVFRPKPRPGAQNPTK